MTPQCVYVCVCMSSDLDSRHNMSDFGTWLVATYLGSWPGCSWHGRRQDCTSGPPFAFRVPPFFSSCCEVFLAPGCGNHAHARACAATATSHAWAPTRLYGDMGRKEGIQENSKYILTIGIHHNASCDTCKLRCAHAH